MLSLKGWSKRLGALGGLALAAAMSMSPQWEARAQAASPALDLAWFEGTLPGPVCNILPPDPSFVQNVLTRDGVVERRTALIIGNAAYAPTIGALRNPRHDAIGMARLLQKLGFEVHVIFDGAASAITACATKAYAKTSDLALLHYSGHGVQFEYQNFLLAADLVELDRTRPGLVSLDDLISRMRATSKSVLVFLDACRDNPLSAKGGPAGLAPEAVVARGARAVSPGSGAAATPATGSAAGLAGGELFVAFATSPNSTASDGAGAFSPFTGGLLSKLATPGWSIQRITAETSKSVGEATNWAQTPWSRSSLTREIFLNGAVDPAAAVRASQLKAAQSRDLLAKGDRKAALVAALQGLPETLRQEHVATYREAYDALYRAERSRTLRLPVKGWVHTSFNMQGTRVATVSMEIGDKGRKESLKLWNAQTGQLVAELLPLERSGTASSTLGPLKFSGDGRLAIHFDPVGGNAIIWDAETGRVAHTLPRMIDTSQPAILAPKAQLSASGRFALISGSGSSTQLYDVSARRTVWKLDRPGLMAAAISPDETFVVTAEATSSSGGGSFQKVHVAAYATTSNARLWSADLPEESWGAYGVTFSDEGRVLGITTSSDSVLIFDTSAGTLRKIPSARVGGTGLRFSPDGRHIAILSEDNRSNDPDIIDKTTGEKAALPLETRALLDVVHDLDGAEVGIPYFDDAGPIWRKEATGPALHAKALSAIDSSLLAEVAAGRVAFR